MVTLKRFFNSYEMPWERVILNVKNLTELNLSHRKDKDFAYNINHKIIYFYSKTNKMHLFLKVFILVKHSTYFGRCFCPSSGAQDCTYSNRYMCSLELLMMDGNTIRNVYSVLQRVI
jgi:hypothetical protein